MEDNMNYFILLIFTLFTFQTFANCKSAGFKVGWEPDEYPPFQVIDKNNKKKSGLDFEIIQLLKKETGCKFNLIDIPWARLMLMLEEGEIDIVMAAIPSKDRLMWSNATVPYIITNELIFAKKRTIEKYPMLKGKDIIKYPKMHYVLVRGYHYGPIVQKAIKDKTLRATFVTKDKQALDMIHYDRVDATFFDGMVAQGLLKQSKYKDITHYKNISTLDTSYSFLLSKKSISSKETQFIQKAFKKIINSKKFKKVLSKYQTLK
jgi:ABC-type amino acid transport substrate-binding protein